MIYLDNAATSWPKPPEVLKAMIGVLEQAGGNPGRSGHRLSISAARVIYNTREEVARFFGISDPLRVIFTSNVTHSINQVVKGLLKTGDHVVTSSMEHNSVMRPLRQVERNGVEISVVPCTPAGVLNTNNLATSVKPNTKLVIITHASNVCGTILPISEVAEIAHKVGALLLVDAAQTAGVLPINMEEMGIDLLAFTGHKELQGPTGIGGLVIGNRVEISQMEPLIAGGTGSRSEYDEQPEFLPDKFEGGTPNLVGIAGLGAGIKWINSRGISEIRHHLISLYNILVEGLSVIPGVMVYGTLDPVNSVAIVSFRVKGKSVSELGMRLDEEYGILVRVGLHCAPVAHKTMGSYPEGTVRISMGVNNSADEVKEALKAINRITGE